MVLSQVIPNLVLILLVIVSGTDLILADDTTTAATTTTASTTVSTTAATSAATTTTLLTTLLSTTINANATTITTTYATTTLICFLKCQNGGKCYHDMVTGEMSCICPGNWDGGLCENYPAAKETFLMPCRVDSECAGVNQFCTNKPAGDRYVWPKFVPYIPAPTTTQAPFVCICPSTAWSTTIVTTTAGTTTVYVTTTSGITTTGTTSSTATTSTSTSTSTTTTSTPSTTSTMTTASTTYGNTTTTLCICDPTVTTVTGTGTTPTSTTAATTTAQTTTGSTSTSTTTASLPPGVTRPIFGICYCKPGYYFSAELAGCVANDPCAYGETCRQIEGGWCEQIGTTLNCTCPTWMTDIYCNATVPIWGNWTDWSACEVTCGTCRQIRTRPCIDHRGYETSPTWCNNHFGLVRGHIEMKMTNFSTPCLAADNPCTRDPCNSNVFNRTQLHTCIQSTLAPEGFVCNCAPGFSTRGDSPLCFEDSKCLTKNDCQLLMLNAPAQRKCIDMGLGNYTCQCPSGFQHDPTDSLFRKCIDIDECAAGTHNCDSSDRATCFNTVGSFYCACNQNLIGDGTLGNCRFDVFTALTSNGINFTYIEPNLSDNTKMNTPCISAQFPVPLLTEQFGSRFYATWNGLIVATNYNEEEMCNQFNFGAPPTSTFASFKVPKRVVGVVAPYWSAHASWADTDKNYTGQFRRGIYYQVLYNKTSLVTGVYADKPTPTVYFQLLVIWHKMQYVANPNEEITFYSWIGSDYINTWAGAGFADKLMNWNIISDQAGNYPVRVGVFLNSDVNVEWAYSWAAKSDTASLAALKSPDSALGILSTEYGKALQWTIGDESSKTNSPYRPCADWALDAFSQPRLSKMQTLANYCPPSRAMTLGMYRFQMTYNNTWMECFQWVEGAPFGDNGEDEIFGGCCYDLFTGSLLAPQATITFNAPGHVQRKSSGVKTLLNDANALTICCIPYKAPVCNYFASTVGGSSRYKAPAIAAAYGGGHIVTFDGLSYDVRGLGDYTLADIYDPRYGVAALRARFQGRLSLASKIVNNTQSTAANSWNWTAFTSFAVKIFNPDSPTVEVRLNLSSVWGYDILIDQVPMPIPCLPTTTTSTTTTTPGSTTSTETTTSTTTTSTTTTTTTSTSTSSSSTTSTPSTTTTTGIRQETCQGEPDSWICQYDIARMSVKFNEKWVIIAMYNGAAIKIRIHPYFLSATFFTAQDWNDNSTGSAQIYKGMFGNRNGLTADEIQTNFGVQYDTRASSIWTFAKTWLVTQTASLFTYSASNPYKTARLGWLAHVPNLDKTGADAVAGGSPGITSALTDTWCYRGDSCILDAGLFANIMAGRNAAEDLDCFTKAKTASLAYPLQPSNLATGVVFKIILNAAFASPIILVSPNGNGVSSISPINVPNGFSVMAGNQFSAANITRDTVNETTSFILAAVDTAGVMSLIIPSVQVCHCLNNGTCQWDYGYTMYTEVPCLCPAGTAWSGHNCEEDLDPCTLSPCSSGICTRNSTYRNQYTCKSCPPPYKGDGTRCYLDDPCSNGKSLCRGLAKCRNAYPNYVCDCPTGYVSQSGDCLDIDECFSGTAHCTGNSFCVNTPGSYKCSCLPGFRLDPTGICRDINECLETLEGPCASMNNSVCINSIGSYSCQCVFGYTASSDKTTCLPVNMCNVPSMNCEGICTSGNGTYSCSCRPGFTLSSKTTCTATTACTAAQTAACGNSPYAVCYVGPDGTAGCTCRGRYEFSNNDCVAVNECTRGKHMCDLSISTCQDTTTGYTCKCNSGYTSGSDSISCLDVNECAINNGGCNALTSKCVNTPGSFYCACNEGYSASVASDGTVSCVDIDECQLKMDDCAEVATCTNTQGGYKCACPAGYTGTGQYCVDIDECAASPGPCTLAKSFCTNTPGSYYCTCQPGTVNTSNVCVDIDWCSFSSVVCPMNSTCANVAGGSYNCTCQNNFTWDGLNCVGPRSCISTTCLDPIGQICIVDPKNFTETCVCKIGFTASTVNSVTVCTNLNECSVTNSASKTFASVACPSGNSNCLDTIGSYNCTCADGYALSGPGLCTNINECLDVSTCPLGAICTDSPPPQKFACACPIGYTLQKGAKTPVGDKCVPVDMCAAGLAACASSDKGGVCVSGNGTYTCSCGTGWTGDGYSCYDVNECAAAKSPCPQGCTNSVGTYTCFCYPGYVMDGFGVCQDIDECTTMKHNCDQTCINVPGTFQCGCQTGFMLEADGKTCKPLASCPTGNGCSQLCALINSTQKCFCKDTINYYMDTDGKTCKSVDFCSTKNPCIGGVDVQCANVPGGFTCTCKNGYKLSADGLKCVDRDGVWSDWTLWTECSKSCGGGIQSQNRSCTNPSPIGAGLQCTGDSQKTQACNPDRCTFNAVEQQYAVDLSWTLSSTKVNFVTAMQTSGDQVRTMISDAVNSKCQKTPSACCQSTASDSTWDQTKVNAAQYTSYSNVALGNFYQTGTSFQFSSAVAAAKPNPLCILSPVQARRKRDFFNYNSTGQIALPQNVLTNVMSDPTFQQNIANWVQTQYGISITWSNVAGATNPTPAPNNGGGNNNGGVTSSQISNGSSSSGLATWVIPVAVVGGVVVIAIIIIIIVIVVKKKPKVSDGNENNTRKVPATPKKTSDPVKKIEPEKQPQKKQEEPSKKKEEPPAKKEAEKKKEEPAKKSEPPKKKEEPPKKKPASKKVDDDDEVVDEIELKKTTTTKK